jgi:hypothetical protein
MGSPVHKDFNDLRFGTSIAFSGQAVGNRPQGGGMIRIKVQYDAVRRVFKLVDPDFKTLLEGDALYDLNVPLVYEEADVEEYISTASEFLAHA